MPCSPIALNGKISGLACTRGRQSFPKCSVCKKPGAKLLCDGVHIPKFSTCDVPLCERCSYRTWPNGRRDSRDLCPQCRKRESTPNQKESDAP